MASDRPVTKNPSLRPRSRGRSQRSAKTPHLSVVIPLYDESESLRELYAKLQHALRKLSLRAEIIFVDDGSTDSSFAELKYLHSRDKRIRVIQFRRNYGKSAALSAGFERARGRYIVTMDADLQDDPEEIRNLIDELEKGFDLVSGWKRRRKDRFIKRISSKIFNRVTSIFTGVRLHDINCGLKIYRREVTQTIRVYGELHRYIPVLAQQEGFTLSEVEVKHHSRKHGSSKFGPSRFFKGFLDLMTVLFLTRYTKRPLHLFGFAGAVTFLVGLLLCCYLAVQRLLEHTYLTNRPLLFFGMLLMIIGVQTFSIGLIGEMLAATTRTPSYSVKNELGFLRGSDPKAS